MNSTARSCLRVAAAAVASLLAGAGQAQTSAAGPYYASPAWDQTLPASTRFVVLTNFASKAVLDRETGLVWERAPSATLFQGGPPAGTVGGIYASDHCVGLNVGGRSGWRLPSVQDLMSLIDRTQTNPALPAGSPFMLSATTSTYWTATAYLSTTDFGPTLRDVDVNSGLSGAAQIAIDSAVWCVRGGTSADTQ